MRKSIKYNLLGLALILAGMIACDTAEQDVSPIGSPDGYTKATFTTDFTGGTVDESDTIVYTVTINKTIDRSLTISARIISGTANDDDITVVPGVIEPYKTTAEVMVIFNEDWDAEATETMKLEFGVFSIADRYLLNETTVNPVLNLTLNNVVSGILSVSLDWHADVTVYNIVDVKVSTGTYSLIVRDTVEVLKNAYAIDFDMFVSEAVGFDIADPWSSNIVDAAATGSCPEVFELSGLADGEYVIWTDLWANGLYSVTAPTVFYGFKDATQLALVTTHFTRQGTALDLVVAQDPEMAPTVDTPGYDDDGTIFNGYVAKIIVAAGQYTIEDFEGTQSGPWKSRADRTPRPARYIKQ
jgi:hypothetical protein